MGSQAYCRELTGFVQQQYPQGKSDLYAAFMLRNLEFSQVGCPVGMITIPTWMFISSFAELRDWLLNNAVVDTFIHNGRGVWGSDFGSCSFVIINHRLPEQKGIYRRLFDRQGSVADAEVIRDRFFTFRTIL